MFNKGTTERDRERERERERGKREIDSHKREGEGVKKNPSLATADGDQIPSRVTTLLLGHNH